MEYFVLRVEPSENKSFNNNDNDIFNEDRNCTSSNNINDSNHNDNEQRHKHWREQ